MNLMIRLAAAALVVAALAIGGWYVAVRPTAVVGPPAPTVEGTWETEFSRTQMLAAGIVDAAEDDPANYGHFTLLIGDGRWSVVQLDGPASVAGGTYTLTPDAIGLTSSNGEAFDIPYDVTETTLSFGEGGPVTFRTLPWTRIAPPGPPPGTPLTLDAYRAAWAQICTAAKNAPPIPNEELYAADRLYDPGMSATDRAKSLEVGRTIADRGEAMADRLQALNPPATMAVDHFNYVARGRGTVAIILKEVDALERGDFVEARDLDQSTGQLSSAREEFEARWNLEPCP